MKQHYLPKFYLKGFSKEIEKKGNKQNVLWFYNKESKNVAYKSIENLAYKKNYYSFINYDNHEDNSIETFFSKLENDTAKVLRKIEEDSRIIIKEHTRNGKVEASGRKLTTEEKNILLVFIFFMLKRTPSFMDELEKGWRPKYEELLKENNRSFDYSEFRRQIIESMVEIGSGSQRNFLRLFDIKNLEFIYNNFDTSSFITTDNPFIVYNLNGPDGLAYPETNIFFPLSKKLILRLYDLGENITIKKALSQRHIFNLNVDVAKRCYNHLFSDNEKYLKKILKKLNLDWN